MGDAKALSQLNSGKDDGRLAELLASYGGLETHPFAYDSEGDRGNAYVQFTVKCSSGNRIFSQIFIYVSGKWRPNFANFPPAVGGPVPATSWPTTSVPTEAPQPSCR